MSTLVIFIVLVIVVLLVACVGLGSMASQLKKEVILMEDWHAEEIKQINKQHAELNKHYLLYKEYFEISQEEDKKNNIDIERYKTLLPSPLINND